MLFVGFIKTTSATPWRGPLCAHNFSCVLTPDVYTETRKWSDSDKEVNSLPLPLSMWSLKTPNLLYSTHYKTFSKVLTRFTNLPTTYLFLKKIPRSPVLIHLLLSHSYPNRLNRGVLRETFLVLVGRTWSTQPSTVCFSHETSVVDCHSVYSRVKGTDHSVTTRGYGATLCR